MTVPKNASPAPSSGFLRELALPAPGRPNWANPAGVELIYLGWGKRYYGRESLPITRHTGWAYIVIPAGTPTLELPTHRVTLRAGQIFVMHPDCPSGWSNRPDGVSSVLSWIWTEPPPEDIAPPPGDFRLGHGDAATIARLQRIHAECRREVQIADAATPRALKGLHRQLEAEFSRVFARAPRRPEKAFRFALACRWLHENLGRRRAIALLGEYLDLSSSDLHRLFTHHARCGPAVYLRRERMLRAEQMVQQGVPVKAAAYALGYAHANDLSRAYRRQKGRTLAALARRIEPGATRCRSVTPG